MAGIKVGDLGMRQLSLGRGPCSPWLSFGPHLQHDRELLLSLPKAQRADPPLRAGSDPSLCSPGWRVTSACPWEGTGGIDAGVV